MNQNGAAHSCQDTLGNCCVPGAKLPLFKFPRRQSFPSLMGHSSDTGLMIGKGEFGEVSNFLDMLILSQWEDRASHALFRYDVTACETKVLPGEYGFIAQLNEGRHLKKRPSEFGMDQVLQPFDPEKFNFTKAAKEELLFCLEPGGSRAEEFFLKADINNSPTVVIINVSPIEYGHVLLVPWISDCIPQRIDVKSLLLALNMIVEVNNPFFRIGYNSLGAFATINHLHFQAYYLASTFPVERSSTVPLGRRKQIGGIKISELLNYPVKGLVFESGDNLEELASAVANACCKLQDENIAYNLLIADRGLRIFLFPQCYAARQACGKVNKQFWETQVNPAVWEISGHIVLKHKEDYKNVTEEYAWKLLAEVSLDDDAFDKVKNMCLTGSLQQNLLEGDNNIIRLQSSKSTSINE